MAFLGSGTHQAHFMEKKSEDKYFANVDPYYNNVEYVSDSISVTTAAIHIGIGMAEGLAEAFLDPTMAVIAGAFLAAYGITAALLPTNYVLIGMQLFSVAMVVLSVYSMLKAGDELGDALNGDYSEKEKAEMFGKAAVMLLLAAGAMYGSMAMVMQPKMMESIIEHTKDTMRMGVSEVLAYAKILRVNNVESLLTYSREFASEAALAYLEETVQGSNVHQLHQIARLIRKTKEAVGTVLREDDLIVAMEKWKETGAISEAVLTVVERVKWVTSGGYGRTIKISEKKMYQIGDHFNKHGRKMGYTSKKEYEAGAREFFQKHMDDAEIRVGKWNSSRGEQGGERQIIVRAEGKQLIINKDTKQLINFYKGTSLDGFIEIRRWQ